MRKFLVPVLEIHKSLRVIEIDHDGDPTDDEMKEAVQHTEVRCDYDRMVSDVTHDIEDDFDLDEVREVTDEEIAEIRQGYAADLQDRACNTGVNCQ
jgi:hypothetical protein